MGVREGLEVFALYRAVTTIYRMVRGDMVGITALYPLDINIACIANETQVVLCHAVWAFCPEYEGWSLVVGIEVEHLVFKLFVTRSAGNSACV